MLRQENGKNLLADATIHRWRYARSDLLDLLYGIHLKASLTFFALSCSICEYSSVNQMYF